MKYKDEIFNRPRRQWIISKEEKRKLNENVMKQLKLIPESGIKVKNEKNNKKAGGRQGRKQNRKFGKQKKIYGRKNFWFCVFKILMFKLFLNPSRRLPKFY